MNNETLHEWAQENLPAFIDASNAISDMIRALMAQGAVNQAQAMMQAKQLIVEASLEFAQKRMSGVPVLIRIKQE